MRNMTILSAQAVPVPLGSSQDNLIIYTRDPVAAIV